MDKNFKKIMAVTAFLIATTVNLNAQWFLGGNVGLNINKGTAKINNTYDASETRIGFNIGPKGGYYLNEKLALGLSFSIGYNLYKESINTEPYNTFQYYNNKGDGFKWNVTPFVRYSVYTHKRFSLILEGSIGIGSEYANIVQQQSPFMDKEKIQRSTVKIGVFNITPILGFKLTDHFQLETGLNFLNLGYSIDITTEKRMIGDEIFKMNSTIHNFNTVFNSFNLLSISQLTIGVVYKF
jgi:hypothetical protein